MKVSGKSCRWGVLLSVAMILGSCLVIFLPRAAYADPVCQNGGTYVVFARGSDAKIGSQDQKAFLAHLHFLVPHANWSELGNLDNSVGEGKSPDGYGFEYPAVGLYSSSPTYGQSVEIGTRELINHLNHRYAPGPVGRGCLNETVVLAGYSQGADVIGWALEWQGPEGLNSWARRNIGYAALFGDPKRGDCRGFWARGGYRCDSYPRLGPRVPYAHGEYVGRFGSWCDDGDGICATNFSTIGWGNHVDAYKNYWYQQSAWEIASKAKDKLCELNPGSCPGTRLMGDVNGDGMDDAVVMFRDSGTALVSLSSGSGFWPPSMWCYQHTVGADKYFLADVNGDNRADLVSFWASNGRWRVSLSSGQGFWPESDWAMGQGVGTSRQFLARVNNDAAADLVTFDIGSGDWHVSLSSGSGFWPPSRWIAGHGAGSNDQQLADFSGDGMADAAVWFAGNGSWYGAASNGSSFGGYWQWSQQHGIGSTHRFSGDVNGDGRADIGYMNVGNGDWKAGTSSGSGFWNPSDWAQGHGIASADQFLAKVNGDNRADLVTFNRLTGDWHVSISSGTGFWPPVKWLQGHGANS